jgi:HD-GYP domain-containing protein (c-di-GMP phosphodiesterase class II)
MVLAEQLVGEARTRRARRMAPRERVVLGISALLFIATALVIALVLPNERQTDATVVLGLVAGHALLERVRFEFGGHYGTAEQLMLVPLMLLAPLPYVPLLIALSNVVATVPEIVRGSWHGERVTGRLADCWYCVPPVLVLAVLAPGDPSLDHAGVYLVAFIAQIAGDFGWSLICDRLLDHTPVRELTASAIGITRADAIFSPIAFMITLPAVGNPWVLLSIGPLTWLLHSFAKDRQERYAKTLELHRAYRGTVMLLSDVIESEDTYTAHHSRSVVELVNAVADELGVPDEERQELEFAAMLHDVGKIAIPKEILNKPAALTASEFEVMKTHTIEGQFMLDRVGGLLGRVGEIVRSCHERWDGAGYPDGLARNEIPFASRIVFACDAYNAMTTDRVYRGAMSKAEALAELAANSGTQFDPGVVDAVKRAVEAGHAVFSGVDEVRAVLANSALRPAGAEPPPLQAAAG